MIRKTHILLLTLIVSCLSCAHTGKSRLESKCTPILNQIFYIQDSRELSNLQLQITTEDYEAGVIPIEEFRYRKSTWATQEAELRAEVNRLYAKARRLYCLPNRPSQ
jgi:hypothetical protein